MGRPGSLPPRMLFLDDDRKRAVALLTLRPEAIWVQTATECIEQLQQPWDEVHLDHDLGGETFVNSEREDCGMEVVRWLCDTPRPHLKPTRFYIHTHNLNASCTMLMQLESAGYRAQLQPFGAISAQGATRAARPTSWARRGIDRVLRLLRPLLAPGPRY